MTIFTISKTFLSNTPAFTDRKNNLPQWAVISLYVLQLKGVCLLFGNSCSSVSDHFSISLGCWLSQEQLDWAEKRVTFSLFLSLSLSLSNAKIQMCLCTLSYLFSFCGAARTAQRLLFLGTFHYRKGIVMLEYKYKIGAAWNTAFQKQNLSSKSWMLWGV